MESCHQSNTDGGGGTKTGNNTAGKRKTEQARLRYVNKIIGVSNRKETKEQLQLRRKQIFKYYDADNSGDLDKNELRQMLEDMYVERIRIAEIQGASRAWVKHAMKQVNKENGRNVIESGVQELLVLRDLNKNKKLDWKEFSAVISREEYLFKKRNRFWRLAPLADIPIYIDNFANGPYHSAKILLAGAAAGVIGKTFSSPLSRLTILQQTGGLRGGPQDMIGMTRYIIQTDGIKGLLRGNTADVLRQIPYAGSQYVAYEYLKNIFAGQLSIGHTPERMLAGGLAGAFSIALTFPLDTIRARMAIQTAENIKYQSIMHAFRKIVSEEGIGALYRGCGTAIAERFPNMAINFGAYELIKSKLAKYDESLNGMAASLISGGIAGIISTTICFPLDLIMRNLQTGAAASGPFTVASQIYSSYGLRGFYSGLTPQLIKALPYTCAVWMVYDYCKRVLYFEVR